jgi:hypothetical protein
MMQTTALVAISWNKIITAAVARAAAATREEETAADPS